MKVLQTLSTTTIKEKYTTLPTVSEVISTDLFNIIQEGVIVVGKFIDFVTVISLGINNVDAIFEKSVINSSFGPILIDIS